MSEKKKDLAAQSRHEDEMLNRTLLWIGGAALLILFLLFLNRYYIHYRGGEVAFAYALHKRIVPAITFLALAGCVIGALLFKKAKSGAKWYAVLSVFCLGLALCAGTAWKLKATGVQFMCGAIPAAAVLALVYYLFQREFFLIAVGSGVGIAGLWAIRRAGTANTVALYGTLVVALVLLVVLALFGRKLQAADGVWKGKQVLAKTAAYSLIYITCVVMAVLLVAAALAGSTVAYYLMFPAVAWVIIMAVYFTVKLM